jgi:hypothetical protein
VGVPRGSLEGRSTADFDRRLHQINNKLRIDRSRISYPHADYPTCGLYRNGQYLLGIPQKYAPRWSLCGLDFNRLREPIESTKYIERTGYLPEIDSGAEFKLLWRGYQAILEDLCRRGLINEEKAEKIFGIDLYPKRGENPKNFIQLVDK